MPVDFCRHLVGKLSDKCLSSVIALRHTLLLSQWSYGHFLKLTDSILFELDDKSSPFNSTHYIVLYPQNGDRIVTIDSVMSLYPMYTSETPKLCSLGLIRLRWLLMTSQSQDSAFSHSTIRRFVVHHSATDYPSRQNKLQYHVRINCV